MIRCNCETLKFAYCAITETTNHVSIALQFNLFLEFYDPLTIPEVAHAHGCILLYQPPN